MRTGAPGTSPISINLRATRSEPSSETIRTAVPVGVLSRVTKQSSPKRSWFSIPPKFSSATTRPLVISGFLKKKCEKFPTEKRGNPRLGELLRSQMIGEIRRSRYSLARAAQVKLQFSNVPARQLLLFHRWRIVLQHLGHRLVEVLLHFLRIFA